MTKRRFGKRLGYDRMHISVRPEDEVDPKKGTPVLLRPTTFTPDPTLGMREVANLAYYQGLIGFIAFFKDDWSTIEGSAVLVGPGAALTGFHVVAELIAQIVSGELQLMLFVPSGDGGRAWRIRGITRVGDTDIAILSLSLGSVVPKRRVYRQAVLGLSLPSAGELVMISGFKAAPDVVEAENDVYFPYDGMKIKSGLRLYRSVGLVVPTDRANPNLVQVDVRTSGGMSGGPAFNSKGECFGILSTSIDHGEEDGTSYVHALWPGMATEFDDYYLWPGNKPTLFTLKGVEIVGRELLAISEKFGTGQPTVTLRTPKSIIEI